MKGIRAATPNVSQSKANYHSMQNAPADASPLIAQIKPTATQQRALSEASQLLKEIEKLQNQKLYSKALPLAEKLSDIIEKTYGPNHTLVAETITTLANIYREQDNSSKAKLLHERALQIRERAFGVDHPKVAQSLTNIAILYDLQGNSSKAQPFYERALRIQEKVLGTDHPDLAPILSVIARTHRNQRSYSEARAFYQRSLQIWEQALGLEHPNVAQALNNLAELYQLQGNYSKAEPLYERALKIHENALGLEHPNVATSLNNLAELYRLQGNYAQAEPLHKKALQIHEKTLGTEHLDVALSLNNLAELYRQQGNYSQAESLHQRAFQIREKILGPGHPDISASLNNLALLYQDQGFYLKAEPLYKRALNISKKSLGAEHPKVALFSNNLANLYFDQGLYPQADSLYERALSIREKSLGVKHPDVAMSLHHLAGVYRIQGLYPQAEAFYKRSLSIRERVLGDEHPEVADSLNNLAILYQVQGLYPKADSLYQRALNIYGKAFGNEHPSVATILNNLALLYKVQKRYSQAESLYKQSLDIKEKVLGTEHPGVAQSLTNLAELYQSQDSHLKATPLYQRALRIGEKTFGTKHPEFASILNNLAFLYRSQGLYPKADPLYQRALDIQEEALGTEHPAVAQVLNNLAEMYQAQGQIPRAHQLFSRAADIEESILDLVLSTGSENRKRAYLALSNKTDAVISLNLQDNSENLAVAQLALNTILRRKGRVLASLTDSFQNLRQNLAPTDRPLLEQLNAVRSQRATLTFKGAGKQPLEQYRATLTQLKTQEDELENQLARKSSAFRVKTQPVTIAAVQQQIPQGAALIELVKYDPFNAKATKQEQIWASPHYAAYILSKDGNIQWVNLGEAEPIDQAAIQFRQALKSESDNVKAIARQLDQQLMAPIRAKLGNTRQLLLSPDSELNLIPFAALVDENNQYLVENYGITYLSSGRDLLRLQNSAPSKQPPLILANPDYQNAGKPSQASTSQNRSSRDLNLTFGPLPGTQEEGTQLKRLLPNATLLSEKQATENALKQVQSPEVLHIATHGFFLETDLDAAPNVNEDRASIGVVYQQPPQRQKRSDENPLLRSGLALAGANPRKSGAEDGIFTALEATGLNLQGTKLVVLSACETGLGDIANGEGVYGLRRAFVMAGAESQVLSLWKVDDTGTKDLMVNYYQRLKNKEGRGEALRQTQLEMLRSPQYQHPYYWAAFIPSGDWQPLR